jgi:hypothetical protein
LPAAVEIVSVPGSMLSATTSAKTFHQASFLFAIVVLLESS